MNGPTDSRADDGHTLAAACHGFEERRSKEAGVADGSTVPIALLGPSDSLLIAGWRQTGHLDGIHSRTAAKQNIGPV